MARDRQQIDLGKRNFRDRLTRILECGSPTYSAMPISQLLEICVDIGIPVIEQELMVLGYFNNSDHGCSNLAQLIQQNWDALTKTRISTDRLMAMRDEGAKTTDIERCRISQALGINEGVIEALERE